MFGKKDDPLVGVITGIMNDSVRRNEAEKKVNETFGIQSRRALPHERVAEYDAALREAQTKVLKEEDARDRAIRKSQEKEDEKGGYKTAKEWEKYWEKHDPAMARFSRNARKIAKKKGLKESSRAEREARRDDYKYKITGSDKDKEDKIKERITKTTGYKFKKKD